MFLINEFLLSFMSSYNEKELTLEDVINNYLTGYAVLLNETDNLENWLYEYGKIAYKISLMCNEFNENPSKSVTKLFKLLNEKINKFYFSNINANEDYILDALEYWAESVIAPYFIFDYVFLDKGKSYYNEFKRNIHKDIDKIIINLINSINYNDKSDYFKKQFFGIISFIYAIFNDGPARI